MHIFWGFSIATFLFERIRGMDFLLDWIWDMIGTKITQSELEIAMGMVLWDFYGIYPLVSSNIAMEMAIFNGLMNFRWTIFNRQVI